MTPTQDPTSLQQLEFHKILEILQGQLTTPFGPQALDSLDFSFDESLIQTRLNETRQMVNLLLTEDYIPLQGFQQINNLLDKIKPENAFLEPRELLQIKDTLQQMGELSRFIRDHGPEAPDLQIYARGIHYHQHVIHEIESKIEVSAEVFDNASPELRKIRIQIRQQQSGLKKILLRMQKKYEQYSQDDIVTLRDGRMVLGIVPSAMNKVNGIVHGTSGSGATVFIEPMETLQVSNEIQNLLMQERTEVIKILRSLTALVREVENDIRFGIENVSYLDLTCAKARMAIKLDGEMPQLSSKPMIRLTNARHPLLLYKMGREQVVPLDIELGKDFSTVVITGPNAGGKTVSMKTMGLLILMTQMGMLIPAAESSRIPVRTRLLVDIGDRQSLEQDLSTFSAHVLRLNEILEAADHDALILMDEMGTGTDPREGASLAIAILRELSQKGILTVATTHHGELKVFAHSEKNVENGSMEFDLNTLQPTYRLKIGVPGSSYAFEIARRYGMPDTIIKQARDIQGEKSDRLESLILDLERKSADLEKERGETSIKLSQAEAMRRLYERQNDELKTHKARLKKEAAAEAQRLLSESNALIENTVREIREQQAESKVVKNARQIIREQQDELAELLADQQPIAADLSLKKGDTVWIQSLGETGELLDDTNDREKVRVLIGNVKLTVDVSGLRRSKEEQHSVDKPSRSTPGPQIDAVPETVGPELDLRGLTSDEATEKTDRYLDKARESGWEEVRIVHGKGTGALRKAVNDYLSRDRRIAAKRPGKWGEGDTGVTVVTLR